MLINTPDGWCAIAGHAVPPIKAANTERELSARMADELAALCPAVGFAKASEVASMIAKTLHG